MHAGDICIRSFSKVLCTRGQQAKSPAQGPRAPLHSKMCLRPKHMYSPDWLDVEMKTHHEKARGVLIIICGAGGKLSLDKSGRGLCRMLQRGSELTRT